MADSRSVLRRGPAARPAIRRALRAAREKIGDDPRFLPIVLAATPEGFSRRIRTSTDLVVDGFPRSGTTFAVHALRYSNERLRIASHVHVPAQIKLAVRRGLPTIVTLRAPVDAVASMLVAAPHVDPSRALAEYAHHHEEIEHLSGGFLIAPFDVVVSDFGSVIEALNARFGTSVEGFVHSDENVAAVMASIERYHAPLTGGEVSESRVPRPSMERTPALEAVKSMLSRPELRALRERASEVHHRMSSRWITP